jgi:hypothetical protein
MKSSSPGMLRFLLFQALKDSISDVNDVLEVDVL